MMYGSYDVFVLLLPHPSFGDITVRFSTVDWMQLEDTAIALVKL